MTNSTSMAKLDTIYDNLWYYNNNNYIYLICEIRSGWNQGKDDKFMLTILT